MLELTPLSQDTIKEYIDFGISAELADFDVSAGINLSQEFVLPVDDVEFSFLFEDGSRQSFLADEADYITVENASLIDDRGNGDGEIDYELIITPKAQFCNDTEIGLSFGYTLDLIKTSLKLQATLPFEPGLQLDVVDLAIGPLLRVEGSLDALSADIFEDRFDFNAGKLLVVGSVSLPGIDMLG
ncbi:MAG: hypothetical protein ACI87W_000647 [Halieaceae bacterium]